MFGDVAGAGGLVPPQSHRLLPHEERQQRPAGDVRPLHGLRVDRAEDLPDVHQSLPDPQSGGQYEDCQDLA